MIHEPIEIIRGTLWWGLSFIGVAAIARYAGGTVEPLAVACGVVYAVIGVKFYTIAVSALFGSVGGVRRFAVWFPVKFVAILSALWLMGRATSGEILAALLGLFAFLPAGFQYAVREGQKSLPVDDAGGVPERSEGNPSPGLSSSPAEDR